MCRNWNSLLETRKIHDDAFGPPCYPFSHTAYLANNTRFIVINVTIHFSLSCDFWLSEPEKNINTYKFQLKRAAWNTQFSNQQ